MTFRDRGLRRAERRALALSNHLRPADPAEADAWRKLAGKVRRLRSEQAAAHARAR